jgi:hypothetical protein
MHNFNPLAPNEEHLHVDAAHSQGAIGEPLHSEMLKVFSQDP